MYKRITMDTLKTKNDGKERKSRMSERKRVRIIFIGFPKFSSVIMNIQMISPSVYDSNIYILNGTVLIDTGMTPEKVIPLISERTDISKIGRIILTHCHFDHAGCVDELKKLCGASVVIYDGEEKMMLEDEGSAATVFGYTCPKTMPDVLCREGDRISAGKNEKGIEEFLEVISTPGHTSGSMCLYSEKEKTVFSGDTVFSGGGLGRTDFKNSVPEKMTQSIGKLLTRDIEKIYPGHGQATLKNGKDSLQRSYRMSEMMNGKE